MLNYYEIDIIPLPDNKFQNALQMVMNWLSYLAYSHCENPRRDFMSLS
jgi:hypothetical protein